MAPLSTRRQTFIHYSDPEKTDKLEFCRRAFPLVDGAPGDGWHKAPVWGDTACCPEVELQNEARVEEHLSDPARGTHHRSCGASLSERWHRLHWLPEANRKQTVVLFFSSYWKERWAEKNIHVSQHLQRNYDKLKKLVFLSSHDESHELITVCSSRRSLLWGNQIHCQLSTVPGVNKGALIVSLSVFSIGTELFGLYRECEKKRNSLCLQCVLFQKGEQHNAQEKVSSCFPGCLHWRRQGRTLVNLKNTRFVAQQTEPLRSLSLMIEFHPQANSSVESLKRPHGNCSPLHSAAFGFIFLAQLNFLFSFSKDCKDWRSLHWYRAKPFPPPTAPNLWGLLCFHVNKDVE